MLNSFRDTDIIAKGLPTISEVDLDNKSLTEQLEYCNILYLIFLYSTKSHYKKSIRLLQKFVKKHTVNSALSTFAAVVQIWLTCIKFKDDRLLCMNMEVYKGLKESQLNIFRLYKTLRDNLTTSENKEAMYFNNKCIEIFTKYCQKDYSFTYQSFIIYQKQDYPNIFLDIDNKLVYNYTCNTNTDILTRIRKLISAGFNINLLFLYTYISRMGCILDNCTKKCSDKKDKEIRDLLLDDEYLLKTGEIDRAFILKFYNRRKNLIEYYDYLEFEALETESIKFKAVISNKNIQADNKYVSNKIKYEKHKFTVFKEEMYSVIGAEYTKGVRKNLFCDNKKDVKRSKKKKSTNLKRE